MCDCFHVMLPTWPGAPGSVTGRQLQPGHPDAESEEERSVTEGPGPELIRPRPQGSSPVYECVTEGAGFRLPEDAPRRRRSWWKRDSGDSRTLSRMSHLESTQDGTGVTLETEVEAGASGYSVAGGGDQGIFVKQVLKDSSAAKLFSLREGDQLLSTTIFFDNIKYEDALKILQYSEPYKVQFKIRRKLPAGAAEDDVAGSAEPGPRVGEDQDQDVADRCTETPTKTPQGDGDQQRLLPTPREGRGRRAQRERLSWPKFQALKGKRGPRRSHSSSEAYERGQGPDLSPTSTDTEARLPAEEQAREDELGSQRRRRFPSLRFRVVSGKGTSSRGDRGGAGPAELLEEAGPSEAEQEAITAAGRAETGDMKAGQPEEAEAPTEPALPGEGPAPRLRRKKAQARGLEETLAEEHAEVGTVRGQTREGTTEDTQGPQLGTARLTRHGSIDQGTYQNGQPEVRIRIPSLKTPKFRVARETVPEDAEGTAPVRWGPWWTQVSADDSRATGHDEGDAESQTMKRPQATQRTKGQGGGEEDAVEKSAEASKEGDQETEETEGKTRVLKFKLPSFGWSPAKEGKGQRTTQIQETDKQDSVIAGATDTEGKGKDGHGRESKFKTPKFKMPSFGVSAPSKAIEAAVDVSLPKAQAEVTLPSVQADVKTSEVRVELPAAELDVKGAEVAVKLPEGPLPEAELKEGAAGVGIKAHLPKVQMPSVKLPKVDIKAPQVDIKGPKLDLKGAKAEVAAPDVEVLLPSVEVDSQAPGAKLEADVSLGDKEGATRICTLKTEDDGKIHVKKPHFKFPRLFSSSEKSSKSSTLIESDPHLSLAPSVSDVDPALSHISSHKPSLPFPHMGWPGVSSGSLDVSRSHAESSSVSPEAVTLIKYQVTVPDAPHFPPEILSCSQEDRKSPTTLRPEESVPCPPDTPASPVDPLLPASYGRVTFPKFHRPKFWFSSPEAADPAVDGQAAERAPAPWPLSDAQGLDSARGLPLADGSQGHGSGDVSAGQPHGEGTAPSPGERLQPLCRAAGVDAPVEGSTAALGGWFRMPALHLPIIRHPAREKGVPGAPSPMPAACALGEEEPAPISAQGPLGSEVEAPETLEPAEKIASHAGMLKINLDGRGSTPLPPPPEAPPVGLSTSEIRVRPGEGSLPLRMPSGALLETETPPAGPAGLDLARGEGRAEKWSSQPEGPVKLKVSRTDGPSQISVVSVGQPWEGSVVTVKLPRLSMPRFAFPDPGSEADVFIPAVQEVQCAGSSLDDAWCAESVGAWGASILKAGAGTPGEQPVAFDLSPEASRVRVHIHSAQGEGAGVGIHAGVTPEPAGRPGPEAVSTQIVRESEIPASEIQTASYGFSLLKVKIPEPPTQGRVQDSRLTGGLQEASEDAAPGADPVSGDLQPDTGEPFEVISSSVSVPRGPALTADLHSGPPGTESCSDEEPAEILEFPPEEDGEEAAAGLSKGDQAPKEKPEGKRSSGLLRFWLPSIGFSSSSEEARADSKDEAHGPAPVQTPPGLQPEAEPPKKSEKASWFRFPKLGFSSSPTKKGKSLEDEAAPAEQKLQEEAATFFDARENFSPEDREETVPGAGAMVTSRARTELILLEPDPGTLDEPAPGPAAQ